MGNALRAYTEQYEDENQMLFQAIINLRRGIKNSLNRCTTCPSDTSMQLYIE
jgi:hypothetical protein